MYAPTLLVAVFAAALSVSALPTNSQQQEQQQSQRQPMDVAAAPALMSYTTISPDGSCGGKTGYTCESSGFGNCCSNRGLCGSTSAFCDLPNCFSQAGLCSISSSSSSGDGSSEGQAPAVIAIQDEKQQQQEQQQEPFAAAAAAAAVVDNDYLNTPAEAPSPTVTPQEQPVHTPWKPTPFHDPYFKPSYVIDNGERAPNQVWN